MTDSHPDHREAIQPDRETPVWPARGETDLPINGHMVRLDHAVGAAGYWRTTAFVDGDVVYDGPSLEEAWEVVEEKCDE